MEKAGESIACQDGYRHHVAEKRYKRRNPGDYVLMDTWFTNEPFIRRIKEIGLEVIGMLKDTKQQYWYHERLMNLRQLAGLVRFDTASDIF